MKIGKAKHTHTNDNAIYEGDCKNGLANGKGRYIFANGEYCYANWKNDQMTEPADLYNKEKNKIGTCPSRGRRTYK